MATPWPRSPAITASVPGAQVAYAVLTGEGATIARERRLKIVGIRVSGAGAFSFSLRANNGTAVRYLVPALAAYHHVGDGVRHWREDHLDIDLEPGEYLEWSAPEAVAKTIEVEVYDRSDARCRT